MTIQMAIGIPQPYTQFGGIANDPLVLEAPDRPGGSDGMAVATPLGGMFYYIDPTHPLATNDNNQYGYPDLPRVSIPSTQDTADPETGRLNAGDCLHLRGKGLWLYGNGQTPLFGVGTAANPIWISGLDRDAKEDYARFGREIQVKGSYMYFEYMDLSFYIDQDGVRRRAIITMNPHQQSQHDHTMVRRCWGRGDGDAGSGSVLLYKGSAADGYYAEGVIFYDNDFADFGDSELGDENDFHGFMCPSMAKHAWIINNVCKRMGGDSVQLGSASIPIAIERSEFMYIGNNDFSRDGENAIDLKEGKNIVVSTNWLHDYDPQDTIVGGYAVSIHNKTESVYFLNNMIERCGTSVACTSEVESIRFIGNIFRHNTARIPAGIPNQSTGSAFVGRGTKGDILLHNNLFEDYVSGIFCSQVDTPKGGVTYDIQNNIFIGKKASSDYDILMAITGNRDTSIVKNNMFLDEFLCSWGSDYTDPSIVPGWTGCTIDDPMLLGGDSVREFELQAGSPCINAGTDLTAVFAEFQAIFGVPLDGDRWLNQRVQGGTIDIGPWETGGLFVAKPPINPTDTFIDVTDSKLRWGLESVNESAISITKNGTEIQNLPAGSVEATIAGLFTAEDNYQVVATNVNGDSPGAQVTSTIIQVTPIVGDLVEDLPVGKSHLLAKPYVPSTAGLLEVLPPVYTGESFLVDASSVSFTKSSSSVGSGFRYVLSEQGNTVSGTILGDGEVDILTTLNNYDDISITAEFRVKDSVITLTNSKEFTQSRINVTFTGGLEYTYEPTTFTTKAALGLSAVIEK